MTSQKTPVHYWCPICASWFGAKDTYVVTTNISTMRNHLTFGYDRKEGRQTKTLHTVCSTIFRLHNKPGAGVYRPPVNPGRSSEYRLIDTLGGDVRHERAG